LKLGKKGRAVLIVQNMEEGIFIQKVGRGEFRAQEKKTKTGGGT